MPQGKNKKKIGNKIKNSLCKSIRSNQIQHKVKAKLINSRLIVLNGLMKN